MRTDEFLTLSLPRRHFMARVTTSRPPSGRRLTAPISCLCTRRCPSGRESWLVDEIIAKADVEKVTNFGEAVKQAGASTADKKGMWADSDFKDLLQYNDGFRTGLIGTTEQVAERIIEYRKVGIDLVLTGFLHVREDVERFGTEVIPIVRELEQDLPEELRTADDLVGAAR